ncbi:alpha/beta fold hydrolase [bacterium]|nr:alpha/beta fold hydrolase [bacterium]
MAGATGLVAASALGLPGWPGATAARAQEAKPGPGIDGSRLTTSDGTRIYFKDWGSGRPVVFSHGWPLSSDAFESQMFHLASNGFRVIAADRRGHGRSDQPLGGNDLDTFADDLAELTAALDLKDAVHVGHSTGGGEVVRYVSRHGTDRVGKVVLISAIPPLRLQTKANPLGAPLADFDALRGLVHADRSQFWQDLTLPFYGYNRPGAQISAGVQAQFVWQCMMAGYPACYLGIRSQSETDMTEDLRKVTVPALLIHGSDDQLVPIADSAELSVKLMPRATLSVYEGAPHGLPTTHKDRLNRDLLAFCAS